jgi:hypothetical protein
MSTIARLPRAEQGENHPDVADLRAAAAALRRAASARGDTDSGWRLAELAAQLDRAADLAGLED